MKDTRLPPCLLVIRHLLLDAVGLPRQLGQLGGQVAVRGDADSVGVDHRGPCPVRFLNWGLQISKIHFHDFFWLSLPLVQIVFLVLGRGL